MGRNRAEGGGRVTPSIAKQLRLLAKELGTLIGRIEGLRTEPERDVLVRDLEHHLDQLQLIVRQQDITLN
jgi:hypothetical protein